MAIRTIITHTKPGKNLMVEFSVIIPIYNEELNIPNLLTRLRPVVEKTGMSYELLFVNDRFCEMTGYARNDLIGKNRSQFAATIDETDEEQFLLLKLQLFEKLNRRDGLGITETDSLTIKADNNAEILLMEVPV